MKQIDNYFKTLNEVAGIVSPLLYPDVCEQMQNKCASIQNKLKEEKGIKVPIVGNFNSGKSSLLNTILKRGEVLPINIVAETAIPYEIYPMIENEHVELYRDCNLIASVALSEIKSLNIAPGDVSKVYIDNPFIRELATKGIVLVDMPGLDSGIKEHNDAIMHYINIGTAFVLLADIETGALTRTNIAFLKELLSYNLYPAVFLSKTDQKDEKERHNILEYVKSQVRSELDSSIYVGEVSSAANQIQEFINYVINLDPEKLIATKYHDIILSFISMQITSLKNLTVLIEANINDSDANLRIDELKRQKSVLSERLLGDIDNAETPEKSTMDIMDELRDALSSNAKSIATSIVRKENPEEINNQILSILRPVIVRAFKSEGGQYAAALNSVVDDISKALQKSINIDPNLINSVVEEYKEEIQSAISLAAEALRRADNPYAQIVAQILDFCGEDIPDFIKWVFGKNEDDRIAEATARINTTMYSTLQRKLYPTLLEQVSSQQERIRANVMEQVNKQIGQIEQSISMIHDEINNSHKKIEKKKDEIINAISELNNLKDQI